MASESIKKAKKRSKKDIDSIKSLFLEHYKNAKTELVYSNAYELLVCVMLSAQCTDKRVNIVTPALFKAYPSVIELSKADINNVKKLISSISFFNNKSKHLIEMAKIVVEKFNSQIPLNQAELKSLPGVGQKTANVVLIELLEQNYMAVDTHVFRVSHRLGLSSAKTALNTESELTKVFKTNLSTLHQAFVLFGRYICKATNPQCEQCFVSTFCQNKNNFKPT